MGKDLPIALSRLIVKIIMGFRKIPPKKKRKGRKKKKTGRKIGIIRETPRISLIKYGDYKRGNKTLLQNTNSKYTLKTISQIQSLGLDI